MKTLWLKKKKGKEKKILIAVREMRPYLKGKRQFIQEWISHQKPQKPGALT